MSPNINSHDFSARIDSATPQHRDRYLDALRVLALVLVISGHWLVRFVTEEGGDLTARYLLQVAPQWQWATLIWQVMPVFFFVGAVVNAQSWARAQRRGVSGAAWAARRARGLMWPVVPLLGVLVPVAAVAHAAGWHDQLLLDFGVALFPLWFLAAYLAVSVLTPVTAALHARGRSPILIATGTLLAIVVDLLRFHVGGAIVGTQPLVAAPNFLFVWVVVYQLGYLWADGVARQVRSRVWWLLALLAAVVLALMILLGPYPLTMVPIEGTLHANNASPPTAALIALALLQMGLAGALRSPITRVLARPGLWAPVAVLGAQMITLYLWHQPVMVAVANIGYPAGLLPATETLDAHWWVTRPLWLAVCALALVPVVALMGRVGKPAPVAAGCSPGAGSLALAVLLFASGIAALIASRLSQAGMPLGIPFLPLAAIAAALLIVWYCRTESRQKL